MRSMKGKGEGMTLTKMIAVARPRLITNHSLTYEQDIRVHFV